MKSTAAITVIPISDGFIDNLVPGAGAVLVDRLENAIGLGSNHSKCAYLEDVRRFNVWRAGQPLPVAGAGQHTPTYVLHLYRKRSPPALWSIAEAGQPGLTGGTAASHPFEGVIVSALLALRILQALIVVVDVP